MDQSVQLEECLVEFVIQDEEINTHGTDENNPLKLEEGAGQSSIETAQNSSNTNEVDEYKDSSLDKTLKIPSTHDKRQCKHCGKKFTRTHDKKKHEEQFHLPDSLVEYHCCDICTRKFIKIFNLKAHYNSIHKIEMPRTRPKVEFGVPNAGKT